MWFQYTSPSLWWSKVDSCWQTACWNWAPKILLNLIAAETLLIPMNIVSFEKSMYQDAFFDSRIWDSVISFKIWSKIPVLVYCTVNSAKGCMNYSSCAMLFWFSSYSFVISKIAIQTSDILESFSLAHKAPYRNKLKDIFLKMVLVVLYCDKVWQFSIFLSCTVLGENCWEALLKHDHNFLNAVTTMAVNKLFFWFCLN